MIARPSFDLVDHHERAVTIDTFTGRRCLVFFGFTHCKLVCPRALAKFTDALTTLGDEGSGIQGLYVSVDPERDTPARLAQFLEPHPRFLGLTGTPEQAKAARESFGVFARRRTDPNDPGDYEVPHSSLAYLLERDGSYLNHWLDSTPVEEIINGLRADPRELPVSSQPQPNAGCCHNHG